MNKNKFLKITLIFLLCAALIIFTAARTNNINDNKYSSIENSSNIDGGSSGEVELSGRLRIIGNEPFSEFVVTHEDKTDYYIKVDKSEKTSLYPLQGKKVTVFGYLKVERNRYPNPAYDHDKHYIIIKRLEAK